MNPNGSPMTDGNALAVSTSVIVPYQIGNVRKSDMGKSPRFTVSMVQRESVFPQS